MGIEYKSHEALKKTVEKNFFSSPERATWLYNRLIHTCMGIVDKNSIVYLDRPIGAVQGIKERKNKISNALTIFCNSNNCGYVNAKADEFESVSEQAIEDFLDASDVSFIDKIEDEEVLLCWAYVRSRYVRSTAPGLYSNMAVWGYQQSKFRYPEDEISFDMGVNYYTSIGLPYSINSVSDARESLRDFIFCFGPTIDNRRNLTSVLIELVNAARHNNCFDFARKLDESELDFIWDKLNVEEGMLTVGCSMLKGFGFSRIYAAFNLWDIPLNRKQKIEKKLEGSVARLRARKNNQNKERINLTLTAEAKEKLSKAAGGQRQISAFVENWIRSL